jgi:toxin ParE1/3/4
MAQVIWTEPALNALDEIADHIALDDYDAACRLVSKVFEKVELLEENPSLGNNTKDLRHTPYRRLVIKPIYVYYRSEGRDIFIIFVDRNENDFDIARFAR